jgi:Mn-containing catalase
VDEYSNDSTGEGDHGEVDTIGPWNDDKAFKRVDAPAFAPLMAKGNGRRGAAGD